MTTADDEGVEKAARDYAAKLGKTPDELTEQELQGMADGLDVAYGMLAVAFRGNIDAHNTDPFATFRRLVPDDEIVLAALKVAGFAIEDLAVRTGESKRACLQRIVDEVRKAES